MGYPTRIKLPISGNDAPTQQHVRQRALRKRLAQLSMASSQETAVTLCDALQEANREQISPRRRLRLLGQLTNTVRDTVDGLRFDYDQRELPLLGFPLRHARLVHDLLAEMAIGHEVALNRLMSEPRGSKAHIGAAIVGAMHYRSLMLLESWLLYEHPIAGSWQRIHKLYRVACDNDVLARPRRVPWQPRRHGLTPETAYKRIALMAATDPLQHTAADMLDAWWLLGHWADAATISEPGPEDGAGGFDLPRDVDGPPHSGSPEPNRCDDRRLDTMGLINRVTEELRCPARSLLASRRQTVLADHSDLARRIVQAFQIRLSRRDERRRTRSRVRCIMGLCNAYRALGGEAGLLDGDYQTAEFALEAPADVGERNVGATIYSPAAYSDVHKTVPPEHADGLPSEDAGKTISTPEDWQLSDISVSGYGLLAKAHRPYRVEIGEPLITRQSGQGSGGWKLGVVRRLHSGLGDSLYVGVEILGDDPRAVIVSDGGSSNTHPQWEAALLIPASRHSGKPPTLIVSPPQNRTGRELWVRYGRLKCQVALGHCHQANPHIAEFEFEYTGTSASDDLLPGREARNSCEAISA